MLHHPGQVHGIPISSFVRETHAPRLFDKGPVDVGGRRIGGSKVEEDAIHHERADHVVEQLDGVVRRELLLREQGALVACGRGLHNRAFVPHQVGRGVRDQKGHGGPDVLEELGDCGLGVLRAVVAVGLGAVGRLGELHARHRLSDIVHAPYVVAHHVAPFRVLGERDERVAEFGPVVAVHESGDRLRYSRVLVLHASRDVQQDCDDVRRRRRNVGHLLLLLLLLLSGVGM